MIGVDRRFVTIYTGVVTAREKPKLVQGGQWVARFIFLSGRLCLDFAQTGAKYGVGAAYERLHEPADLTDWFSESQLGISGVGVTPAELEAALGLRESIWHAANAARQRLAPSAEDIEVINQAAAMPGLRPQLAANGATRTWQAPVTATAALSAVARDMIDLLSGEQLQRLRKCENPNCQLMFVDTSRPGKRRWCLMERCGNRVKTARYRHRHSRSPANSV
jgi:predicted RNA-binding Zn ribbon-like protein